MIIYFSGTGNSRYAADMLADLLGDETLDSAQYIRTGESAHIHSEKPLVFLCPTYVSARLWCLFLSSGKRSSLVRKRHGLLSPAQAAAVRALRI